MTSRGPLSAPHASTPGRAADAVLVDLLAVGPVSAGWARVMARAGATRRTERLEPASILARPGGSTTLDPDEAFDLILAIDVCAHLDEAANQRLIGRLAGRARPGTVLVVGDAAPMVPLEVTGPRTDWPVTSYARWLTEAGFADIQIEPTDGPNRVLLHAVLADPTDAWEAS